MHVQEYLMYCLYQWHDERALFLRLDEQESKSKQEEEIFETITALQIKNTNWTVLQCVN